MHPNERGSFGNCKLKEGGYSCHLNCTNPPQLGSYLRLKWGFVVQFEPQNLLTLIPSTFPKWPWAQMAGVQVMEEHAWARDITVGIYSLKDTRCYQLFRRYFIHNFAPILINEPTLSGRCIWDPRFCWATSVVHCVGRHTNR